MENVENVENAGKLLWSQKSTTKIGLITEKIEQYGSDYAVNMVVDNLSICEYLPSHKHAFMFLYGVKQFLNDKLASYKENVEGKFERKTKQGIKIYSQAEITAIALEAFREFALPSPGEGKEKKISVSSAETVLASLGLSEDVLAKARQAMGLPVIPSTTPTTVS